jgi:5-methylcytosine-specific restriction endonuclease McrA
MLLKPVRRTKAVKFSRHAIYTRDKGRCQYCGVAVSKKEMQYEHVLPRALGGTTRWENIVVSCHSCNQRKADKTVAQAGMRLLSVPVRPKSLPNTSDAGMCYSPEMPESWKAYLRDYAYWNVALEEG